MTERMARNCVEQNADRLQAIAKLLADDVSEEQAAQLRFAQEYINAKDKLGLVLQSDTHLDYLLQWFPQCNEKFLKDFLGDADVDDFVSQNLPRDHEAQITSIRFSNIPNLWQAHELSANNACANK